MEYYSDCDDKYVQNTFGNSLRPSSQRRSDNPPIVLDACLYLLALFIPVESCGWGHLALLTAGSCFCIHMGIQGKFPARASCVALWSFIAPTIGRSNEFHIRKIVSRETRLCIAPVGRASISPPSGPRCFSS